MSESWGKPTWIFFHTMCEKIKEDNNSIFEELISYIVTICNSLPCPLCTKHAIDYMKKNKTNKIKTKEELRKYLFNFHNEVNKMKNKPIFEYSTLEKYKSESTILVYNTFNTRFFQSSGTMQMNLIHVNKYMLARLHKWMISNQHCFDM